MRRFRGSARGAIWGALAGQEPLGAAKDAEFGAFDITLCETNRRDALLLAVGVQRSNPTLNLIHRADVRRPERCTTVLLWNEDCEGALGLTQAEIVKRRERQAVVSRAVLLQDFVGPWDWFKGMHSTVRTDKLRRERRVPSKIRTNVEHDIAGSYEPCTEALSSGSRRPPSIIRLKAAGVMDRDVELATVITPDGQPVEFGNPPDDPCARSGS